MTCPRCNNEVGSASRCLGCGMQFVRQVAGFIKTSAVIIATRENDGFYGSLHEVPARLRRKLEAATRSENSGTILIADQAGRERILTRSVKMEHEPVLSPLPAPVDNTSSQWVLWAGLGLLAAALVIIIMVWGKWPNG